MRSWNSLTASRRNVSHHYDLDEALFRACLDTDLHYSCAYFTGLSEPLEAAQKAKCEHIARKLYLRPGQKVLDIGCGGLALYLAQHYQVCVTGLTLSVEQLRVAKQSAEELGLQEQVDFQLQDYRQFTGRYDRVVSVGMFEHVGRVAYGNFFRVVDRVLGEGGVALIHTIANQHPAKVVNPWNVGIFFPEATFPP